MDQHRLGKCSSCEAQYRVPATFKADKAKCKKCGGVVEIGAVVGDAPAAKPAPAKQPRAARPAQASKSPRSSGSKAKRKPAPAAAAAPAEKSDKGESVRSATEDAATRVRTSGGKGKSRGKSSRSSSKRKGRSSKKKDSKMGLVLGIVALLLIAGGGGWFLMNKDTAVEAQGSETVAAAGDTGTEDAPAESGAPGASGAPAAATESAGESPSAPNASGAETPAAESSAPEATADASGEDAEAAPEPETEPEPVKEELDLSALPTYGAAPACSDEEWAEIQALVATSIDPNAGARGNRAVNTLIEKGRVAFPAVLNTFKGLDLSTQDGYRDGDLLQKLLEKICQGNNFGWKYTTDEADVVFNEKVVSKWFWAWDQVVGEGQDGSMWVNIAKLDEEQAAAYRAEVGLGGEPAPEVGSAEELEDF